MASNSDNNCNEFNYREIAEEFKSFDKLINGLREKAHKMRVETSLASLELSNKLESIKSINGFKECQRNVSQIESKFEDKPNPEVNPIESKDKTD